MARNGVLDDLGTCSHSHIMKYVYKEHIYNLVFETFFSFVELRARKISSPMHLFHTHSPLLRSEMESYTIVKSLPCNQDRLSFAVRVPLEGNAMLMRKTRNTIY